MTTITTLVPRIVAHARRLGITLKLSSLRDAICVALVDKPYNQTVFSERQGRAPAIVLPPPHLSKAVLQFRLDHSTFMSAFDGARADAIADAIKANTTAKWLPVQPDDGTQATAQRSVDGLAFDLKNLTGSVTPTPLLCHLPLADGPQAAFVQLDADGLVSAAVVPPAGAEFIRVPLRPGALRFAVPDQADGHHLADLLTHGEGRQLLATIHRGYRQDSSGERHECYLTPEAETAAEALRRCLMTAPAAQWDVYDWLFIHEGSQLNDHWNTQSLEEVVDALTDRAKQQQVVFVDFENDPAMAIRETLLAEVEAGLDFSGNFHRNVVRTLVALGRVTLDDYATWIAANDGPDVDLDEEAELDAELPVPALRLTGVAGASTQDIERGVAAALASLEADGGTVTTAYLELKVCLAGGAYREEDAEAWEWAEAAAIATCCQGWAKVPDEASLELS